jgi:endonuclease-3
LPKIKNINEIIDLMKEEAKKYDKPIISALDKAGIKKTPFTTLISCILSLRTKDEITEKASVRLFKKYNNPKKLAKSKENEIKKLIYPVGFYNVKSKRIIDISKELIEKYNGKVPDDFDELLKLKGVGKKTAAIVMVYGYKKDDFIPVDIHVHIISNRLGWVRSKNPDETMDKLMKFVPKKYWYDINEIFVIFGQNICVTVSPFCSRCPIEKYCKKIAVKNHR